MNNFLKDFFGDSWFVFPAFLPTEDKKLLENRSKVENDSNEKEYVFRFPLGGDINPDLLKIDVNTKDNKLTVSYDEESEHRTVHYKYARTIPGDAVLDSANAVTTGDELIIKFTRDLNKGIEDKTALNIPVNFED